jgi:hypothetical protein
MSSLPVCVLGVVVLTGCAGPPESAGTSPPSLIRSQGGRRIKVLRWTTPEGIDAGDVFQDQQLNLECIWTLVDSGAWRCLPADSVYADPIRFADAECARPAFTVPRTSCGETPAFVRSQSPVQTCPTSTIVHKRGPRVDQPVDYHLTVSGRCVSAEMDPTKDLYEYGDAVALDEFVAGRLHMGAPVDGFAQRTIEGEDGSRVPAGFHDFAMNIDCHAIAAADGSFRCLPFVVGTIGRAFSDAACSAPIGSGVRSSCVPAQSFISRTDGGSCDVRTTIFRAGDRVTPAYQMFATGCATSTGAPFDDYWSGGEEVPPGAFLALSSTLGSAAGRLRPRVIGTPAGDYTTGTLWDTALDRSCSSFLMADGTYRCVGELRNDPSGFFADAGCSWPVFPDAATPRAEACAPAYAWGVTGDGQCPARHRVFEVAAGAYGGPLFQRNGVLCQTVADRPSMTLHELAPEQLPGAFVELTPPH